MKWKVFLYEWDPDNGEYVYRDTEGVVVEARDEKELWTKLEERLKQIAHEGEEGGWDCELTANSELECVKCTREGCVSRLIGFDVKPLRR